MPSGGLPDTMTSRKKHVGAGSLTRTLELFHVHGGAPAIPVWEFILSFGQLFPN